MTEFTVKNTMKDLGNIPELESISQYLMYNGGQEVASGDFDTLPISGVKLIGWSPEAMVRGVNYLIANYGKSVTLHYVYDENDCEDDSQKKQVNLLRMTPEQIDPSKPYILLAAGGGYTCVCTAVESCPTAIHFVEQGYQVFLLTYRIGEMGVMPKALADVAAAVKYIQKHEAAFELKADYYAIGGFSAGANLISTWGTTNAGYAAFDLPKPKAMFPVYTVVDIKSLVDDEKNRNFLDSMFGEKYTSETIEKYNIEQHVNGEYPPCYIVCGKDDQTVPCANSELLKARLDAFGVSAILDEGNHAPHGFGDGTGTDVEGWPERAIKFLESL